MEHDPQTLEEAREIIAEQRREIEELRRKALTDDLTKLSVRAYAKARLEELLSEFSRYGQRSASIIFVDVDHFKEINDEVGHNGGDEVLRQVAQVLRSKVRPSDVVARWGGEEFVLVLPGATSEQAEVRAEVLRELLKNIHFGFNPDLRVTASFGVASARKGDTVDRIVGRADTAMYSAKQAGRNRVCVAE
ncbi:MAG: GGDEF domain-containing protein [Candidatus Paceibacterota bacterium]